MSVEITARFTTDSATDEQSARDFLARLADSATNVAYPQYDVRDLALISVTTPPAVASLTVADLVALGVPQDAAERRVNG